MFDYFDEESIAILSALNPDILIRCAGGIFKGEILNVAKYGLWSYHHADNRINRGGPPGFWEWFNDDPVTGTIIQKLNEDLDNGVVLSRQQQMTLRYSWNANRSQLYELSVPLRADTVRKFAERRIDLGALQHSSRQLALNPYSYPLYRSPKAKDLGIAACKWAWRMAKLAVLRSFTQDQWHLLLAPDSQKSLSLRNYKRLIAPKMVFWADPFILGKGRNGELFVVAEEYDYATARGHISALTIIDGEVLNSTPIIKDEYHYSYPFVLRHEGRLYIIPECSVSNRVDAFECREFPYRWERSKTLMTDISGSDPTIISHGGRWWMFLNLCRTGAEASASLELSIFHADHPLSDHWTPHCMNPVVSDVTQVRNAGRPFVLEDGRLVRPAQDCSVRYGHGIRLLEIEELSECGYRQREVARIEPKWMPGLRGIHHIDHADEHVVMDYCVAKTRLSQPGRSRHP